MASRSWEMASAEEVEAGGVHVCWTQLLDPGGQAAMALAAVGAATMRAPKVERASRRETCRAVLVVEGFWVEAVKPWVVASVAKRVSVVTNFIVVVLRDDIMLGERIQF